MCLDISKKTVQEIVFSKDEVSFNAYLVNDKLTEMKLVIVDGDRQLVANITEDSVRNIQKSFSELITAIDHARNFNANGSN